MRKAEWLRSKTLAIGWLVFISILFFLPGSAFPTEDWLDRIFFDKWVHLGLFTVLIFLWCSAFQLGLPRNAWVVILVTVIYGFLVEFIQKEWIPNRSFDVYDVVADTA